jgi:hypothetical protein
VASKEQKAQERQQQRDNIKLREALNKSYAVLEAEKYTQTALAFTFEEAVTQQLQRLEQSGSRIRPSPLERVEKIEKELLQAVETITAIPPEEFIRQIRGRDVNTEEDDESK